MLTIFTGITSLVLSPITFGLYLMKAIVEMSHREDIG